MFSLRYGESQNAEKRNLALEDLNKISAKLSELASTTPRISDKAYDLAVKEIEDDKGPTSVGIINSD